MPIQSKSSKSTEESGFITEIFTKIRFVDIVLIMAVPTLLVGATQFPMSTRRSLAFTPDAPTLLSAIAAHYIHFDAFHLYGNVLLYLLIVPMVYLLLTLSDSRRAFLIGVFPILFGFPFLLSGFNLLLPRSNIIIVGFSGLGMAFVGVLPVALFRFLQEQVPRSIGHNGAIGLFLLGAALIAFRMTPSGLGLAIGVIVGLTALLFMWRFLRRLGSIKHDELRRMVHRSGYVEIATMAPVFLIVATLMAFPANPYQYGGILDLSTHLFGYLLGFSFSFLIVLIRSITSSEDIPEAPDFDDEPEFGDP